MYVVHIQPPSKDLGAKNDARQPVLLFSKLNKIFFGYFDPENIFLDNKNK